jgi:hypothetical protein
VRDLTERGFRIALDDYAENDVRARLLPWESRLAA